MRYEQRSLSSHIVLLFAILVSATFAAACGDSTAPETARVKIQLTDAPADEIAMAEVWISRVYLQGGGGEENDSTGGRVDLFNDADNPLHFDLLTLRDGVTADLTGFEEVTAGMYQSLRFVVDSARVTLVEGLTFENGEASARLITPSAEQSGIKVKLDSALDAEAGGSTTVLVDFRVDESFVIQNGATGIRRILFTPRLHEAKREQQ